jgi:tol-pal system protein YbgF
MTILSRHLQAGAIGVILAAAVPFTAVTAFAQGVSPSEVRSINDQVAQVQRELNVLQRHVYQGGDIELAQAPGGMADMQVRIEDLESRMRDMNGRMEELNHRITVLNDRLDKFSADMEFRLNGASPGTAPGTNGPGDSGAATGNPPSSTSLASPGLPAQPAPPPSAADPNRPPSQSGVLGTLRPGDVPPPSTPTPAAPQTTPAAGKALPDGTPEDQYKYAFALLTKSDYPCAERALQAFVQAHPKHQLAGNAQYWLGETYYVRNDFNNAVRAFATGIQNYRTSPKAPDSVLKLGLSLSALGKTKEACTSYTMLKNEYPKAPQEIMRRAESEQKRLRCG